MRFTIQFVTAILVVNTTLSADIINVPGDWPFIQQAISVAANGDEIIVQPGDYVEHIDLLGKAFTIHSIDPTNPNIVDTTRIIGPSASPTVQCVNGEGTDTVISGFTITHSTPAASDHGMQITSSSPIVTYCVFYDNHSTTNGGGMLINLISNPTVEHCTFSGNTAFSEGGGIYNYVSSPLLVECTFDGNDANHSGGIYNLGSSPRIDDCTFVGSGNPTIDSVGGLDWSIRAPDTGACCLDGGVCMVGTEDDCNNAGGMYVGDYTECATANCPEPCPADLTGDGVVDINDVFEMLGMWGVCP